MSKGQIIGHMACPECDFQDAEIKNDKNEHPYRYCTNCNTQTFTRGDLVRIANMRKKMRPIAETQEPQKKIESPAINEVIIEQKNPVKTGFSLGDL